MNTTNIVKNIFLNNEKQVRSGWKIGLVSVLSFLFIVLFSYVLNFVDIRDKYGVSVFFSFMLSVYLVLKFVDRKKFSNIGFVSKKHSHLFYGFGFAGLLVSLNAFFIVLFGFGTINFSFAYSSLLHLIGGFLLFILVGFAEEMLFRGYIITVLNQMESNWFSIVVSALIFALLHGGLNDNMTYVAVFNLFLGGVFMAYLFVALKNIWMPIGFHIAWNYFQGFVFGVNVSGREVGPSFFSILPKDSLLSGGILGFEGGLINTVLLLFAFVIVWFWLKRKRN